MAARSSAGNDDARNDACSGTGADAMLARTMNLDPGVVMPIEQLNLISPASCGVKATMFVSVADNNLRTPARGEMRKRAQPIAWLASMRHSTGTPATTEN